MSEILAEVLGTGVEIALRPAEIPDVVEDGHTLEENARIKAVAISKATGSTVIADDTGLFVDALNGAPGVHSARYAGEAADAAANVAKLLAALDGAESRRAKFATVVVLRRPDGFELTATGEVLGVITCSPRGEAGFGYDPIFVPDELSGGTFAELSASQKHAVSHRGRALRALAQSIADHGGLPALFA